MPAAELLPEAHKLALQFAAGPGMAYGLSKRILNKSMDLSLEELLDLEGYAQSSCFQSADHREGAAAFLEKRKPVFKGY